jgi:hypothetical protein
MAIISVSVLNYGIGATIIVIKAIIFLYVWKTSEQALLYSIIILHTITWLTSFTLPFYILFKTRKYYVETDLNKVTSNTVLPTSPITKVAHNEIGSIHESKNQNELK